MTPERVAGMMGGIRLAAASAGRMVNPQSVELLLWVASGVDTRTDLARVMGLHRLAVKRALDPLMGRSFRKRGRIIPGPFALIEQRQHPDRQGEQLRLTAEAKQLISSTFAPLSSTLQTYEDSAPGLD